MLIFTQLLNLSLDTFEFKVKRINRLAPAELNKELFDKVYTEGNINTVKEFKQKITEEAENSFLVESDRMLKNDVVLYLVDNGLTQEQLIQCTKTGQLKYHSIFEQTKEK